MKRHALPFLLPLVVAAAPVLGQQSRPVDDAMLQNPPPGEWLSYGRDPQETHYSPLNQITTNNVQRLTLAWTQDIFGPTGRMESTPLVWNGTMFVTAAWGVVYALNARSGEVIWSWDAAIVRGGRAAGGVSPLGNGTNRGAALYNDKLYVALLDGRLVALDAATGRLVWVRQTTPIGGEYSSTGAPRIANGKVIIGNAGAEFHSVRGYVTAYDAETGDQVWRFYTVPGNPALGFESPALEIAATTWSGEWWRWGGGGTAWDSFSFDPEANLVYIGTGNGAPWNHRWRSDGVGDNLFLNCIIAVNADTGELVWYYQTTPADNFDFTSTHTMTLIDVVIDGRERKVLVQAPKNGFLYVLDRLTGELLSAELITHVNWTSGIDMETGRPIETPLSIAARTGSEGAWIIPGTGGAHSWHPQSWNPATGLIYIPGQNVTTFHRYNPDFVPVMGQNGTGSGGSAPRPPQPESELPVGFLLAWDPVTQSERWRVTYETQQRNGGTLSTAGNLVFSGRSDGWFYAHDARSGDKLWEYQVAPTLAGPITYELDGRQYVTVATGPMQGMEGSSGRVWTFRLEQ
jgi:PQQ-dependent dehydrogenase (methanol/ethanol family)